MTERTQINIVIFPFQTSNRFSEVQAGRGGAVQPLRHRQAGRRKSHRAEYLPWLHSLPGDIYTVLEHAAQQSVEPGRQQERHRRFLCCNRNEFYPSVKKVYSLKVVSWTFTFMLYTIPSDAW